MKTLREMIHEARQGPRRGARRPAASAESRRAAAVIDVRDPDEYRDGHIEGATNISRGFLEFRVASAVPGIRRHPSCSTARPGSARCWPAKPSRTRAIRRSSTSAAATRSGRSPACPPCARCRSRPTSFSGTAVTSAAAGGREGPAPPAALQGAPDRRRRPRLTDRVLPGRRRVGTLGVMDGDVVDITNLQRQILHTTADVGKPKVESAARMLKALNPDVNVIALPTRITVDNVMDTIKDYDLIVDGPTTSRRATWSTTRATWLARPTCTARSSSSRAWPPSSPQPGPLLPVPLSAAAAALVPS